MIKLFRATQNSGPQAVRRRTGNEGQHVRILVAIPVYNEERYVARVLTNVLDRTPDVLVIDDGSIDATPTILGRFPVDVIRHSVNRGYGRSMQDAFSWSALRGYDWVITMDCDEQHEPASIPFFVERIRANSGRLDVISGSRYTGLSITGASGSDSSALPAPPERRAINLRITDELNRRLSSRLGVLTDSFCGFKAYRVSRVSELPLTEDGYAFPMQFWVQCAAMGLRVEELAVKLIYNDPNRSFGANLDDPDRRLRHYRQVLHAEIERWRDRLPSIASVGLGPTEQTRCCGCECG